jgi:sulfopyruvate decarboxylase subunit alpha
MSVAIRRRFSAQTLATSLADCGFSPFFGTPCGILAPLYECLTRDFGMTTVAREDNSVGLAAGSALSGRKPAILMQNSGLGQSMNAIASLVAPYQLAMLFIISMRGTDEDLTEENQVMGCATEPLLAAAGVATRCLRVGSSPEPEVAWARRMVIAESMPAALLVPPALFGWRP